MKICREKLTAAESEKVKVQLDYEKFRSIPDNLLFIVEMKEDELKAYVAKATSILVVLSICCRGC